MLLISMPCGRLRPPSCLPNGTRPLKDSLRTIDSRIDFVSPGRIRSVGTPSSIGRWIVVITFGASSAANVTSPSDPAVLVTSTLVPSGCGTAAVAAISILRSASSDGVAPGSTYRFR